MTAEVAMHRHVSAGVTLLIAAILLRVSFYHLEQLNKNGCQLKCNQSLTRYTTVLYVETVVLMIASTLYVMSVIYSKKNPNKVHIALSSPAVWGFLAANLVFVAYGVIVNGMQTSTLHKLRKCDCVKETNRDLTTVIYAERIIKLSMGSITATILLILMMYIIRLQTAK